MMWEIYKNGPIAADFEPRPDLSLYSSGVYKPGNYKTESQKQKTQNFEEYFKIDHSILIYGWGKETDGTKYWLIQNSWGENWGDHGSFKMIRGINELGIESMTTAADPIIVDSISHKF